MNGRTGSLPEGDDGGLFAAHVGAYGDVVFTERPATHPALSASQRRDRGIRRATSADPGWLPLALEAIRELAATGEVFDADMVCARVGEPPSPPLAGAAFRTAKLRGWIELAGTGTADRPQAHSRMTRTWRGRRPTGGGV